MITKLKIGYSKTQQPPTDNSETDLNLFAFGAFEKVCFKNELNGKSDVLSQMSNLSKRLNSVCFFGVQTDSFGLNRHSVIVCDGGKLVGISDATHTSETVQNVSHGFKIFATRKGKFGVLVDNDVCVVDAIKSFSLCECDAIIDLSADILPFKTESLITTLAFLFGIAVCYYSGETLVCSSPNGNLTLGKNANYGQIELSTKRTYYNYQIKSRFKG